MTFRSDNLLYVVNPALISQLSDLQNELLASLKAIVEGFEGFKDVIESLDIPDKDIFGRHLKSTPRNDVPF